MNWDIVMAIVSVLLCGACIGIARLHDTKLEGRIITAFGGLSAGIIAMIWIASLFKSSQHIFFSYVTAALIVFVCIVYLSDWFKSLIRYLDYVHDH